MQNAGSTRQRTPSGRRVLVVGSERLTTEALARLIATCHDVSEVSRAEPRDVARATRPSRPDVVVVLSGDDRRDAATRPLDLGGVPHACRVIVVGTSIRLHGVNGNMTRLSTEIPWRVLCDLLSGESVPPEWRDRGDGQVVSGFEALTPREYDVLERLVRGLDLLEIANSLSVRPPTVRTHLQNIFAKLDVRTRHEAVVAGIRHGLDPGDADVRTPA